MAASMKGFPSSSVCEEFFSQFQKSSVNQATAESNILAIKNDIIFVWNNNSSVLSLLDVSTPSKRAPQTLVCSQPPLFEVNSILLNDSDSHVALIGSRGVAILELPSMYGSKNRFQGGKKKILCKCVLIDERYFSSHKMEIALKILWHPGSPNSSHICVLTSANTVRIYNISNVDCPHQTIQLCAGATSRFSSALGESFISMTFGQPIATAVEHHVIWPLYLLKETGCVYLINSMLWSKNRVVVEGPLRMCPPAEDNYGSDSCDILHPNGSPEALVISTSSGSVMHCLLLPPEPLEEDDSMNINDSLPVLYVYDIAKLELRLTVHSTASSLSGGEGEEPSTPVRLVKDPVWVDCYYCMHSAGVHHVKLPWLRNFEQFSVDGELSGEDSLCMIDEESATNCQQIVCTQPLAESKPCPIRGLAVVSNDLHSTSLYCLLSNFTCLKISVRNGPACKQMTLLSDMSPSKDNSKPTRLSFEEHISELLKREFTNPLIKTGNEQSLTPEQCYQLLSRTTQVFREQYANKLRVARNELDKRVSSLDTLREQQSADLQALREQKMSLTDTARGLAERYEDVCEQDERLTTRINDVILRVQQSMSDLSDGERSLSSHLVNRKEEINDLQLRLDQIKEKYKYQKEGLNKKSSILSCLNESQLKSVNSILSDESQQIEGLVAQLRDMMSVTQ